MKKITIFFISLLLILSGCEKSEIGEEKNIIKNNYIKEQIDKTHLISDEFNFSLNIPQSLSDCKIEKATNDLSSTVEIEAIYTFSFPTNNHNWPNKNGYVKFLDLYIYELPNWQLLLNSGNYKPSHIKTTKQYVYAYDKINVLPSDIKIKNEDIDQIIKSFSLISNNEITPLEPKTSKTIPQGD